VHNELGGSLPALNVAFYYATKGSEVHPNVHGKVQKLKETVKHHFSAATVSCDLLGAKELLELARRAPTTVYPLELAETPISSSGQAGFLCLVNLRDFFSFITDENGNLLRHIFESNVRDYQGRTQVNDEIQESLKRTKGEDFWWLNNGITILATRAPQTGKTLMIEDPQIVNGLQTSTEVYSYFKEHNPEKDDRKLVLSQLGFGNCLRKRRRLLPF